MLLMVFSKNGQRDADWQALQPATWAEIVQTFDCFVRKDGREHFGFRDGISQPRVEGSEPLVQTRAAAASEKVRSGIDGLASESRGIAADTADRFKRAGQDAIGAARQKVGATST